MVPSAAVVAEKVGAATGTVVLTESKDYKHLNRQTAVESVVGYSFPFPFLCRDRLRAEWDYSRRHFGVDGQSDIVPSRGCMIGMGRELDILDLDTICPGNL